jgi:beta-glucosidase
LEAKGFGSDFIWGVASSAYQTEGAYLKDGKGPSIWDEFTSRKNKVAGRQNGNEACDFYHRYKEDLQLMKNMGIRHFRFSISWPRVLPLGTGTINQKGLRFYHSLIDHCLELGISPWVTLYHWDLPLELEKMGGWTNRSIIHWFTEYVELCAGEFSKKVKHWMVLNEPVVFTGTGYFMGVHAPGKKGLKNFLKAIHHASLCQQIGFNLLKQHNSSCEIGTTFSFSHLEPRSTAERDINAMRKADALINRLAIEPTLGKFYPFDELSSLHRIKQYANQEDIDSLSTPFDFVGVQVYTREIVRYSWNVPHLRARLVSAQRRGVPHTAMGWEIYPACIYEVLKKISSYTGVKKIIVTENGAAFNDSVFDGRVEDPYRIRYLEDHISQMKKAKDEGINVQGYFVWSYTDNFEWAEGYYPRFGLVHVDFDTQKRIVKQSGHWFSKFISGDSAFGPGEISPEFAHSEKID